jgi:hypothetical protein
LIGKTGEKVAHRRGRLVAGRPNGDGHRQARAQRADDHVDDVGEHLGESTIRTALLALEP